MVRRPENTNRHLNDKSAPGDVNEFEELHCSQGT